MDTKQGSEAPKWDGPKTKTGKVVLIVVFFLIIAWGSYQLIHSDASSSPAPVATQPERHSDIEAFTQAQEIITKTLKAPSTAKFGSYSSATIEDLKDDGFEVSSYVDSQNSFGAMLRSDWKVVFQYEQNGSIDISIVIVDGKVVYKKEGI